MSIPKSDNGSTVRKQRAFYNTKDPGYLMQEKNVNYAKYLVGEIRTWLTGSTNRILEVGAGQGRFTFELASYVGRLWAMDVSKKEIASLRRINTKLGKKNIHTFVGDIFHLDRTLKHTFFDHIVGFFILHHLPKDRFVQLVSDMKRMLKNKGRLLFVEPNNLYPFHIIEIMLEKDMEWEIEKGIYSNYLSKFKKACLQKGMRLIAYHTFGFFPPPMVNIFGWIVRFNFIFEGIPLFNRVFCPYMLLVFEKV